MCNLSFAKTTGSLCALRSMPSKLEQIDIMTQQNAMRKVEQTGFNDDSNDDSRWAANAIIKEELLATAQVRVPTPANITSNVPWTLSFYGLKLNGEKSWTGKTNIPSTTPRFPNCWENDGKMSSQTRTDNPSFWKRNDYAYCTWKNTPITNIGQDQKSWTSQWIHRLQHLHRLLQSGPERNSKGGTRTRLFSSRRPSSKWDPLRPLPSILPDSTHAWSLTPNSRPASGPPRPASNSQSCHHLVIGTVIQYSIK